MDLSNWLALQNTKVRDNSKVVTLQNAYHISDNARIKQFIPVIGLRQNDQEDRTIPRVCVAPTLVDCICGHAGVPYVTFEHWSKKKTTPFVIYKMPFKQYIRPNKKLVYDVEKTNEHWVVPNDPSTTMFGADIVGSIIMYRYSSVVDHGYESAKQEFVGRFTEPVEVAAGKYVEGYVTFSIERSAKFNVDKFIHIHKLEDVVQIDAKGYREILNQLNKNIK